PLLWAILLALMPIVRIGLSSNSVLLKRATRFMKQLIFCFVLRRELLPLWCIGLPRKPLIATWGIISWKSSSRLACWGIRKALEMFLGLWSIRCVHTIRNAPGISLERIPCSAFTIS